MRISNLFSLSLCFWSFAIYADQSSDYENYSISSETSWIKVLIYPDGPLKHLKNEWKFKEVNNSTQLEFFIDFELKNPILNGIMKKSFELGLNKIAKAFEERAIKLYK